MPEEKRLRDMSPDEIAQLPPAKFKELADRHNDNLEVRENQQNRREELRREVRKDGPDDLVDELLEELLKDRAKERQSFSDRIKSVGKTAFEVVTLKPLRDDFHAMQQAKEWERERNEREAKRQLAYPVPSSQRQHANKPLRDMSPDEIAQLTPENFSKLAHEHNNHLELRESAAGRNIVESNGAASYAAGSALSKQIEKKVEEALAERSEGRKAFQAIYDSATEVVEMAVKSQLKVEDGGLARGFLKQDKYFGVEETTPDADHGVRPGEKLASGQTKGMEDKESKARSKRMDNAVFDAMLEYGNRHSSRNGEWPEPASGISDRPGERLVSRDLKLTGEAKERAAKSRSKGRGGPG